MEVGKEHEVDWEVDRDLKKQLNYELSSLPLFLLEG